MSWLLLYVDTCFFANVRVSEKCVDSNTAESENAQRLLLIRQTVDGLCLPVFRYTVAVDFIQYTEWFCSTFYAEVPAAVVESEIRVADFRRVAPLCAINFMRSELINVFNVQTKRR